MARPIKDGVDYFPLDTVLDTKFELIEAEYGLTGFAVVVKLFQKIYGEHGYYCEWTKEVALLFSRRLGLGDGGKVVSEIVSAAVRRGIFDKEIYDKYQVLTSKGIQERYFEAVNRRKEIRVENKYLLVHADRIAGSVCNNRVNVDINPENVCNNSQSKEKKTKLKKSKGENTPPGGRPPKHKYGTYRNILLTDEEYGKLKAQFPDSYSEKIEHMSRAIEMKGYKYKSHYLAILSWAKSDPAPKPRPSYDIGKINGSFNDFDSIGW
ncbi:MAG: DUF4373 domain-containing protein [Acutalibacteraceae bacterium]